VSVPRNLQLNEEEKICNGADLQQHLGLVIHLNAAISSLLGSLPGGIESNFCIVYDRYWHI
jgi:hypothetical protein